MHRKPDFSLCTKYIKKYWKILLPIFVLIVAIVLFVVYRQKALPELFSYVPAGAEQVVVNRPARNISNIGDAIAQVPQGVKAQFQQIQLMLMAQMEQTTGGQLIFLQTYNGFDPQAFLETINDQTEVTSTYKRLDDGIYVFGLQKMINKYTKPSADDLFFTGVLADFGDTYRDYGMTIISSNTTSLGLPSQVEQLFANIKYVIMAVNSQNANIQFASHVVFRDQHTFSGDDFKPVFKKYLKGSTIGYLEVSNLASLMPSPQLNTSLTGEDLVKQAVIAELIQQLGKQHVGLIISKGSNSTNIGVTLAADSPNLFASLKPWIPTLGQWLQNQEWLAGTQITPVEKNNSVGYMITLTEGEQIGILLEQEKNETALRIGNPLLDGSSSQKLRYNDHSLASLNVDLDQAMNVYKQIVNMGLQTDLETTEALSTQFKNKSFNATLFAEPHGLGLQGAIQ